MPVLTSSDTSFSSHLLDTAGRLCTSGFAAAALVMSQSACELACEQALSAWLDHRGMRELRSCLRSVVASFNVANSHTRDFYNALTGDPIQQCSFWPDYVALVHNRNLVVHDGQSVDCDEARRCIAVARQVVEHLVDHTPSAGVAEPSRVVVAPGADGRSVRPVESPGSHNVERMIG